MSDFVRAPLTAEADLAKFDCGTAALNTWLTGQALRAQAAGVGRTHLWSPRGNPTQVAAYFTLAATQVDRTAVPRRATGGYTTIPSFLLGRLALDCSLQGQGWGTAVLLDALRVIIQASELIGGRLVLVGAIDEAAYTFYLRHEFHPATQSGRLFMKLDVAHALVGEADGA